MNHLLHVPLSLFRIRFAANLIIFLSPALERQSNYNLSFLFGYLKFIISPIFLCIFNSILHEKPTKNSKRGTIPN